MQEKTTSFPGRSSSRSLSPQGKGRGETLGTRLQGKKTFLENAHNLYGRLEEGGGGGGGEELSRAFLLAFLLSGRTSELLSINGLYILSPSPMLEWTFLKMPVIVCSESSFS